MSEQPYTNGNGNGNGGWKTKSFVKSLQLLAGDVVQNIVEVAFLRYQESFDAAVPWLKSSFKWVAKAPVKALQDPIETALEHANNFEGKEAHDVRMHQTKEERLEGLLDVSYHYASAGAVGLGALVGTEKALSKVMKTAHTPNWVWWCVDAPLHLGLIATLGAPSMQPTTDALKGTIKNVMKASGWDENKAEQDARFATVYIVPNYVNWISTSATMAGLHYYENKGVLNIKDGLFKNISDLAKHLKLGGSGPAQNQQV